MDNENNNTSTSSSSNVSATIADAIKKYRPSFGGSSGGDSDGIKKMLIGVIVLTLIVVILLLILSKASSTSTKKGVSYSDIEDAMTDSAKRFFKDNNKYLPKSNGGTVEISAQKLINENYLSAHNTISSCTGKVVVQNNDDNYIYVPYLDCGSKYKTTELYRKVTNSSNIVSSGSGLYNDNGTYIFRGDTVNNYVQIGKVIWRIVKVTNDNLVELVRDSRSDSSMTFESYPWDDRLNVDKDFNSGINNFELSRIKDTLDDSLSITDDYEQIVPKDFRGHLVATSYCIGKRGESDSTRNMSTECSQQSSPMKVGLLTVSEFMDASLDGNCNSTFAELCENYNYLNMADYDWWTITGDSANSYQVYYVESKGSVVVTNASSYKKLRPVIYLDSKTMFKSGKGTLEKPYKIK